VPDELGRVLLESIAQEKQNAYRTLLNRAYQANEEALRAALNSKTGAERFAAAYVVGERQLPWQNELIEHLTDPNPLVRQSARRSLVILSFFSLQQEPVVIPSPDGQGVAQVVAADFGPAARADRAGQEDAAKKWRDWWGEHGKANRSEIRAARSDADIDSEAAKLSAALVFADPSKQAEKLATYRQAKGIVYTEAMANALSQLDGDSLQKGREYLAERLTRMTAETLRSRLSDPRAELRRAAALAWAAKDDRSAVPELIPLLNDPEDLVVRGTKAALKSLTGQDFGPARGASAAERSAAVAAWKNWWRKQG
jgi:HEAT repeat protein